MNRKRIGVIGGTGNLGYALAWRWARAGYRVIIGSRDPAKAGEAAARINSRIGDNRVDGADNLAAATQAEIVVLTVPYAVHQATLDAIKPGLSGQIVIDTTVPLRPPKVSVVQLPEAGPVASITQAYLGDAVQTAAAFHNVSAKLLEQDTGIDCDILVTANDKEIRNEVMQLVEDTGCHALDAGVLANAAASEAMTSVLIHMNKTYKVGHAGIQITGLKQE